MHFKTKSDVAQNLFDSFFSNFDSQRSFHRSDFKRKKIWDTGLISEKTEALYAEPNERAEAATSIYSAKAIFENIFGLCL